MWCIFFILVTFGGREVVKKFYYKYKPEIGRGGCQELD